MASGLRAECAVFGTSAAFRVDNGTKLSLMTEVPDPNSVGRGQQLRYACRRCTENLHRVRRAERRMKRGVYGRLLHGHLSHFAGVFMTAANLVQRSAPRHLLCEGQEASRGAVGSVV